MDQPGYVHSDLANILKEFLMTENCCQIVNGITRVRSVGGVLQRSCLDHVIVNCVNKMSSVEIIGIGESDHLGTLVTKQSKEIKRSSKTTMKRGIALFMTCLKPKKMVSFQGFMVVMILMRQLKYSLRYKRIYLINMPH